MRKIMEKLHNILGYAAFGIIIMWLIGWTVLNSALSYFVGFSIASFIHINVPLWLMLTTAFILILASGFVKYREDNISVDLPNIDEQYSSDSDSLQGEKESDKKSYIKNGVLYHDTSVTSVDNDKP